MTERTRRRERPKHFDHTSSRQPPGLRGGRYRPLDDADVARIHDAVSYTHLRAHETVLDLVCRLLLEKKKRETSRR